MSGKPTDDVCSDDEEVGVKNIAGERETIQFPKSQAKKKKRQSQHLTLKKLQLDMKL